jgi:hypothetical protein
MPSFKRIIAAVLSALIWTIVVVGVIIAFIVKFSSSIRIWVDLGAGYFAFAVCVGVLIVSGGLWQGRRAARRQKGTTP